MTGYAPTWMFAALAVTALAGVASCSLSMVLRPVLTGVVCRQDGLDPEVRPFLLFVAVAVAATTFWVLGA